MTTVSAHERRLVAVLVVVHALVSGVHGLAHEQLPVTLAAWQQGFVLLVPSFAPFVALYLLYRDRARAGVALLVVSMAAAFLFGVTFHYLLPNPDNVAMVPAGAWGTHFEWTAAAIALTELVGAVGGGWLWLRERVQAPGAAAA